MRALPTIALLLTSLPAMAQTTVPPVTATPLAPPARSREPVLVPVAPPPPASALPPGPAVPLTAAPPAAPSVASPPGHQESRPSARLPDPPVDDNAPPSAFVTAARSAIAAGRTAEAMEAIERAESRLLVRSVRPSRARDPSDQALVKQLAEARTLLGGGDRTAALDKLAEVLRSPWIDAPEE